MRNLVLPSANKPLALLDHQFLRSVRLRCPALYEVGEGLRAGRNAKGWAGEVAAFAWGPMELGQQDTIYFSQYSSQVLRFSLLLLLKFQQRWIRGFLGPAG